MDFITLMAAAGQSAQGAQNGGGLTMLLPIALLVGMMFFMNRSQKKKQKEEQEKRDSVQIGDEITTIGGIMGRVVTVKEETLIIETGADRNKMKIAKWAISVNNTANEKAEAERQAQKEAAEAEKQKRMEEAADKSKAKRKKSKKKDDTFDMRCDPSGRFREGRGFE